jgi:hypothetical protein
MKRRQHHEQAVAAQEQSITTANETGVGTTGKEHSISTDKQQGSEKDPEASEQVQKTRSTVSSSDGDTRNDDGARSESTVNAERKDDSPRSPGSERAKRKLVENVLEQKRRASRESSRRSQERQRKRIEHLTHEEMRLQNLNQRLRVENHSFRQAKGALQAEMDARLEQRQQPQHQATLLVPPTATNPAITTLQQLATAATQYQTQSPHQPSAIIQGTAPPQQAQNNPFFALVNSLQQQINVPASHPQHQQYQQQQQQHTYQIHPIENPAGQVVVPSTSSGGGGIGVQQPARTSPQTAQMSSPDQSMLQELLRVSSQTAHHELLQVLSHFVNNMVSQSAQGQQASQLSNAQPAAHQLQSLLALLCVLNVVLNQQTLTQMTTTSMPASASAVSSSSSSMSQQVGGHGFPILSSNHTAAPSQTSLTQQLHQQTHNAMSVQFQQPPPQQQQPPGANPLPNQFVTSFSPLVQQQQQPLHNSQASTSLQNQLAMIMNTLAQQRGQLEQHQTHQQQQQQQQLPGQQSTLSLLGSFSSHQQHGQFNPNLQTTTSTINSGADGGIVHTGNQPFPSSSSPPSSYTGHSASDYTSEQQQQQQQQPPQSPG